MCLGTPSPELLVVCILWALAGILSIVYWMNSRVLQCDPELKLPFTIAPVVEWQSPMRC